MGRLRSLPWLDLTLALACCAGILAVNLHWLGGNTYPPEGDYALHLVEQASFRRAMLHAANPVQALLVALTWPGPYPAGVYAVSFLFEAALGPGLRTALVSQQAFLPPLVVAVYALTRRAFGPASALAATLATLATPGLLQVTRKYLLDFPVASATAVCVCLLAWADGFRERRATLALGVAAGVGMLLKFTLFWFLGLPLALVALGAALRWRRSPRHLGAQALVGAGVGLAAAGLARLGMEVGPAVLSGTDLLPPRAVLLSVACWSLAFAWWRLAGVTLRAGERDESLRNAVQAAALGWAVVGPWYVCNQSILEARWRPVRAEFPQPLEKLLPWLQDFVYGAPGWPYVALLVLGLLACCFRRSAPALAAAGLVQGMICTFLVLAVGERYLAPAYALAGVVAVASCAWLRFAPPLLLGLALVAAAGTLLPTDLPVLAEATHRRRAQVDAGYTTGFAEGTTLAPAMPPGVLVVKMQPDQPARPHEIWFAMQAWADWNEQPLVPLLMEFGPEGWRVHELNPYLRPRNVRLLRERGDGTPGEGALSSGPPTFQGYAGVLEVDAPELPPEAVERLLGGPATVTELAPGVRLHLRAPDAPPSAPRSPERSGAPGS